MPILLAAATAVALAQSTCSWDRPGVDPYRGTPEAALAHYRDIPAADRKVLAQRIAAGAADDRVKIGRDAIEGQYSYEPKITDMHFGAGRMCRTVTRTKWKPAHVESAAVYCVNDQCIVVPEVCGNVSRIRRVVTSGTGGGGSEGGGGGDELGGTPPPWPTATIPYYSTVPAGGDDLPPWMRSGVAFTPVPSLESPGPGRSVGPIPETGPGPVSPVPEPSTWAMLLGGLGVVIVAARRRHNTKR